MRVDISKKLTLQVQLATQIQYFSVGGVSPSGTLTAARALSYPLNTYTIHVIQPVLWSHHQNKIQNILSPQKETLHLSAFLKTPALGQLLTNLCVSRSAYFTYTI